MIYAIFSVLLIIFLAFVGYRAKQRSEALRRQEPVKFHPLYSNNMRELKGATARPKNDGAQDTENLRNPWLKDLDTNKRDILRSLVHEAIQDAKKKTHNTSSVC